MKKSIMSNAALESNFNRLEGGKKTIAYFEKQLERLPIVDDVESDESKEKEKRLKTAISLWNDEVKRLEICIREHAEMLKAKFGKIPGAFESADNAIARLEKLLEPETENG